MSEEIFEYQGSFYIIEKDLYEVREIYMTRVWYILNNINKMTFDELIKMSRIYVNKKFLKCDYDINLSSRV